MNWSFAHRRAPPRFAPAGAGRYGRGRQHRRPRPPCRQDRGRRAGTGPLTWSPTSIAGCPRRGSPTDGLLMNETGRRIREQVRRHGRLRRPRLRTRSILGYAFASRIRDLPSKRLCVFDRAGVPKLLRPLVGGKVNVDLRCTPALRMNTPPAPCTRADMGPIPRNRARPQEHGQVRTAAGGTYAAERDGCRRSPGARRIRRTMENWIIPTVLALWARW